MIPAAYTYIVSKYRFLVSVQRYTTKKLKIIISISLWLKKKEVPPHFRKVGCTSIFFIALHGLNLQII